VIKFCSAPVLADYEHISIVLELEPQGDAAFGRTLERVFASFGSGSGLRPKFRSEKIPQKKVLIPQNFVFL
jgi:hypothetical protein